ncbi:MAG: histidine kinase dimerization/phospho-acceptor domain-containing protein, partial [Campylobacterota bacterium]|nr:histidine kinase dimerization/phospho-acceptor domain-containing protein [Campylobacterota bacterium]
MVNSTAKYNLTVLYVEDDRISREVTLDIMEGLFQNIIIAVDGEDGFLKFENDFNTTKNISLVITDIEMPKLNGFKMLSKIRELNKDIFSIIISGHSFNHYMKDISHADILNNYLPKPLIIKDLITLIDEIIIKIDERVQFKKERSLYVQYQNAFDYSAIVSKTDRYGIITYVNDAFCKISGYRKDELIGQPHNIVRHPDMPKSDFENMWRTVKAKMFFRYSNMKNKAKDGSTYYVDTVIVPILDENRNIYEYIAIRYDTTALHKSLLEERKAKQSQQTFLANMSHEIRTPLNGVLGFTKLLKQSDLKDEQKEFVDIVDSSANSLLHTINEILDISKLQDGNMDIELIDFDPYMEFTSIKKLFKAKADEKNINLVCKVCESAKLDENKNITLTGDILRLKQVLSNLLSNAIK